jgi:hypothetical protein
MVASEVTRRILATYEAGDLITMCAWCKRVKVDGEWLLAPRAALAAIDAPFTLTHSICQDCMTVPWPTTPDRVGALVTVLESAASRR